MVKENLLISGCLVGKNVKYDGGNNYQPLVQKLKEKYNLIVICPEVMGGLSIPRFPSEIIGNSVYQINNTDVTNNFNAGASKSLEIALKYNCKKALLKEKSPSCGSKMIYDGSFNSKTIFGQGITTRKLLENGIKVYSELEIKELLVDE